MPTYEYRCPNGHDFEKFFRSISSAEAESAIVCPACGAIALRQMSSAGLMFKGSGFYLTDYGKNAHGRKAPPATAGSTDGSTSGGGESSGGGEASAGGGESAGRSGDASGTSESRSEGGRNAGSSDGAAKGSESKTASKKADTASTPTKPSSGKPGE